MNQLKAGAALNYVVFILNMLWAYYISPICPNDGAERIWIRSLLPLFLT